jgi:pimeloyl-ACP methyl ester carboxylesterase
MPALEARGVELSWNERGEGPAVLLIHETATSSAAWEPVAEEIAAQGGRALLFDRRGWGGSSAPDGYVRTTIEEQSEDAAALLEAAGGPAVACGAGIGAVIALDLQLRHPDLVAAAVLIEPPVLALVPEATEQLSADRRALEVAAGEGRDSLVRLYLSGGLGALAAGVERLPEEATAPARERPASVVAEIGAPPAWAMPVPRLTEADPPPAVVVSGSTPALLRSAATALAARSGEEPLELEGDGPPHRGDPAGVARVALAAAGASGL